MAIKFIRFWKRDPESIEKTLSLEIDTGKDKWILTNSKGKRPLTDKEKDKVREVINSVKNSTDDDFCALLYEDNRADFSLKFFLTIRYSDNTYYALKGRFPFKQKNYKTITDLFNPLF